MSSSKITDNASWIEAGLGSHGGAILIMRMPEDPGGQPETILFRMSTYGVKMEGCPASVRSQNSLIIDKRYAKALVLWFRHSADLMEKWYPEATELHNGENDERKLPVD